MMSTGLHGLFANGRRNARISWLLVALVAVVWLVQLAIGAYVWSVFALAVLVLAVLPPLVYRSREVMLPWEVLALSALPIIGLVVTVEVLDNPLFDYLAVAAVALVIVVELDAFTTLRMSRSFAIGLVVAATMAAAAAWAMVQWYATMVLSTGYDPTNDELMIEFVYSTLAGLVAGGAFRWYFRERVSVTARVPGAVAEETLPEAVLSGEPPVDEDGGGDRA